MEVIILCALNLLSFVIGAKIGQKVTNGKEINVNPVKAFKNEIRENREEKKNRLKQDQIDTMLYNIDNYSGNGLGQKEIPKE